MHDVIFSDVTDTLKVMNLYLTLSNPIFFNVIFRFKKLRIVIQPTKLRFTKIKRLSHLLKSNKDSYFDFY